MPTRFRLASFNTLNYLAPPGAYYQAENIYDGNQWRDKQRWMDNYLKELDADIIAFQEIFSPDALKAQMQQLGYGHFCCLGKADVEEGYIHSSPPVALASRFPIEEVVLLEPIAKVSELLEDSDFAYSRGPLRVKIRVPEFGLIQVYVVHFKSQRPSIEADAEQSLIEQLCLYPKLGGWLSAQQRCREGTHLLGDYLSQTAPPPTAIMGDFNDGPDSLVARLFQAEKRLPRLPEGSAFSEQQAQKLANELRFQHAYDLALQESPPVPSHYWGPHGSRIDHILLNGAFDAGEDGSHGQVEHVWVADRHLLNPHSELDRQCSDHAAIVAEVSVRE
ncbi:endonuclease/exonuclease/phosphatase family protein [Aliagarivorans marinus]|uniref:endonuclease/exonuclease/phosphatase family protein n=1 Tax=Aliagarivorans marinus TaxID=561965 RepID=UPI000422DB8D|nr:endonuclease/exonuclease/phosphatase family protein [Aliagarivorans marinus]